MTDWGAMHDRIAAFKAGCDLNMPGRSIHEKEALDAVAKGELDEADIDKAYKLSKKWYWRLIKQ